MVSFLQQTQTYIAVKEWLLREELRNECLSFFMQGTHRQDSSQKNLMSRVFICTGKVTHSIS